MEQNLNLSEKYYAYDLSEIFEFDESITFLFVFEPKCGNLEFGDDGYSARVIKDGRLHKIENWDCSNYKNIYYLKFKMAYFYMPFMLFLVKNNLTFNEMVISL